MNKEKLKKIGKDLILYSIIAMAIIASFILGLNYKRMALI